MKDSLKRKSHDPAWVNADPGDEYGDELSKLESIVLEMQIKLARGACHLELRRHETSEQYASRCFWHKCEFERMCNGFIRMCEHQIAALLFERDGK